MATRSDLDRQHLEGLRRAYSGPMSEKEVDFLRDIQGFLDFVIRNGLSFPLAVGTLCHDVNGIARSGFSMEDAETGGFEPNVSGYAESHEDSVGAPEGPDV